jgi:hypothetical protein
MLDQFEWWLKNTIPGVVFLGALGSLFAIALLKTFSILMSRLIPVPISLHRERKLRQAYYLGYIHHVMHDEETGKSVTAFLIFRFSCLTVWLAASGLLTAIFCIIVLTASVVLTIVSFISIMGAFVAAYFAYFEFEYIYRTYLFFWGASLKHATQSYAEKDSENERPVETSHKT